VSVIFIPVLLFSIIIHECAHGLAALRAGDPTARDAGRITLNPLPHLDIVGSIILPIFLIVTRAPFLFGWAKPVPVNPYNFRRPRRDAMVVAAAGPLSNLLLSLAFLLLAIFRLQVMKLFGGGTSTLSDIFFEVLYQGMLINLVLAFFNLIPVPPLDGSHILANFVPGVAYAFERLRFVSFLILIVIITTPLINIALWPVRVILHFYYAILRATL